MRLLRQAAGICTLIVGALVSSAFARAADNGRPSGQNCNLSAPPKNAGEEFNHGVTLKIYPRARDITKDYTGCQIMWMPHEKKWVTVAIVAIERGDPVRIWAEHESDPAQLACRYKAGKVVRGDPQKCPGAKGLIVKSVAPGCVARIVKLAGQFPPDCKYE